MVESSMLAAKLGLVQAPSSRFETLSGATLGSDSPKRRLN